MILLARVGALFIGGTLGSARLTLALFSVAGVLGYGYFCLVVLRSCAVSVSHMARVMAANVAKFIPVGLIVGTLKYIGVPPVMTLVASAVLLAVYYAHFIHSDSAGREVLSNLLRRLSPLRTNSTA